MRALLDTFLHWLADRRPTPLRRSARPAVEALESRTALSSVPSSAPGYDDYRIGGTNTTSTVNGYKWPQSAPGATVTITYSYSNLLNGRFAGGMAPATIKAAIQEALGRWAAVAPLRFVEVPDSGPAPSKVDYVATGKPMMRFGQLAIDGQYNILAYGYYPGASGLSGDLLFDAAERWTLNPATGTDLLEVATHEIGHALGLAHEPVAASGGTIAIMNPMYSGRFRGLGTSFLYADDIAGIRALYGAGVGSVTTLSGGSTTPPAVTPPSPFLAVGSTLFVNGTSGNDTFRFFDGPNGVEIEVNGESYAGSLASITSIQFDGKGGRDVITLVGGSRAETFTISAGTASVTGGKYAIAVTGLATIVAAAGAGDRLVLGGTDGNDVFTASPTTATLASGAWRVTATGFGSVVLNAGAGVDKVSLYDSPGDDVLTATPTRATLAGTGYSLTVNGFARVNVYATAGTDRATLAGSDGDDVFAGSPIAAWLRGDGFLNYVKGFDSVTATAGLGVKDVARLYDGPGNDRFVGGPSDARMTGPGYEIVAAGFDAAAGVAWAGGADTATLNDSLGDDLFLSYAGLASMTGPGYRVAAVGFRVATGTATTGSDRAVVYDGSGNDTLAGSGGGAYLARSTDVAAFAGFDRVIVVSAYGGVNRRANGAVTFQLVAAGAWS